MCAGMAGLMKAGCEQKHSRCRKQGHQIQSRQSLSGTRFAEEYTQKAAQKIDVDPEGLPG